MEIKEQWKTRKLMALSRYPFQVLLLLDEMPGNLEHLGTKQKKFMLSIDVDARYNAWSEITLYMYQKKAW